MANITYIKIGNEVYRLHDGNALTSESILDASKVRGTLPANTYIDTTYENKTAVEGGTDVSLVTTGDKYRWNQGGSGSDVFVATYGQTTYTELETAINNNKVIYVTDPNLGLTYLSSVSYAEWGEIITHVRLGKQIRVFSVRVSDNSWSELHNYTLQNTLVSGTNIKTINNQSILGSGDITVSTVAAQIVRW